MADEWPMKRKACSTPTLTKTRLPNANAMREKDLSVEHSDRKAHIPVALLFGRRWFVSAYIPDPFSNARVWCTEHMRGKAIVFVTIVAWCLSNVAHFVSGPSESSVSKLQHPTRISIFFGCIAEL